MSYYYPHNNNPHFHGDPNAPSVNYPANGFNNTTNIDNLQYYNNIQDPRLTRNVNSRPSQILPNFQNNQVNNFLGQLQQPPMPNIHLNAMSQVHLNNANYNLSRQGQQQYNIYNRQPGQSQMMQSQLNYVPTNNTNNYNNSGMYHQGFNMNQPNVPMNMQPPMAYASRQYINNGNMMQIANGVQGEPNVPMAVSPNMSGGQAKAIPLPYNGNVMQRIPNNVSNVQEQQFQQNITGMAAVQNQRGNLQEVAFEANRRLQQQQQQQHMSKGLLIEDKTIGLEQNYEPNNFDEYNGSNMKGSGVNGIDNRGDLADGVKMHQMVDALNRTELESKEMDARSVDISSRKGQVITYEGDTGGYHSYCKEEVMAFVKIINYLLEEKGLSDMKMEMDEFFTSISRKPILNIIIEILFPCKNVNERDVRFRYNMNPSKEIEYLENLNYAIMAAKNIGVKTYNIEASDLYRGNQNLTLSIVWQILKIGFLSKISVKNHPEIKKFYLEGENVDDQEESPQDILLKWFNYHINKVDSNRKVTNFSSDIMNGENYLILFSQLEPDVVSVEEYKKGTDLSRAIDICTYCKKLGLLDILTYNDIMKGNRKLNLAFVAYLFDKYSKSMNFDMATSSLSSESNRDEEMLALKRRELEEEERRRIRELEEEERRRIRELNEREEQLLKRQEQIGQEYRAKQEELQEREALIERNYQNAIMMKNVAESKLKQQFMQYQQQQQQQRRYNNMQRVNSAMGGSLRPMYDQKITSNYSSNLLNKKLFPIKRLVVEILKARRLLKSGLILPSPYAIVLRGSEQYKTKVCKLTEDPNWDTRFDFRNIKDSDSISISIFDRQVLGKDEFLGFVKLEKQDLFKEGHTWYSLSPRPLKDDKVQGDVLLNLKIIP